MTMSWRLARALEQLREQINLEHPNRSKKSDGTIGDAAHAASLSDHNPDAFGVVRALDVTHDPAHGVDIATLAEQLRASRDPRIKYVIANRRIFAGNAGPQPWVWRPYAGSNPHTSHVHVSVRSGTAGDDAYRWSLAPLNPRPVPVPARPRPTPTAGGITVKLIDLRNAHKKLVTGAGVKPMQRLLGVTADGKAGVKTQAALKAAQKRLKLDADAVFGPATATALLGENR
jgi:peptidoglycan hydrolase-like protein with peptidoglycan-binding domain